MTPRPRVRPRPSAIGALTALLAAALLGSCTRQRDGAPDVEFLVSAGDSTYWVRTVAGAIQVRGSPLALARVKRRFRELYVVDEDRSFEDALFIGQRLYQRDIITNDSSVIFRDTIVSALADAFLRVYPDARRLAPDEDPSQEPGLTASAELSVLGVVGPYLSLEYHVDTAGAGEDAWHMTRMAVVDLRTDSAVSLTELLPDTVAGTVLARGRELYRQTVDSIRADTRPAARRAARAMNSFHFDPSSFSLVAPAGTLMVAFSAPGAGVGGEGFSLPIPPVPAGRPEWWIGGAGQSDARDAFPTTARGRDELWEHGGYTVRASYDSAATTVRLSVVDSAGKDFVVRTVSGPVHRIYWLDAPPPDRVERNALARAFDEAALYDDDVRTASSAPAPRSSAFLRLVSRP